MSRRWALLCAAVGLALGSLLWCVPVARAAGNGIELLDSTYTVQRDGSVEVEERITYRFAKASHGIERGVTVREPYNPDKSKDRIYSLSVTSVTADKPVSTDYRLIESTTKAGKRSVEKRIRIGDPDVYVSESVVTYTLRYRLTRAVMSTDKGDEFHWDVVPADSVRVDKARVTVKIPGGPIADVTCFTGTTGGTDSCAQATRSTSTTATFQQSGAGVGSNLTVAVLFPSGAVDPHTPELVPSADLAEQRARQIMWGATGTSAIASGAAAFWWIRRRRGDSRFKGVPPGVIPPAGDPVEVGRDDRPEIPVAFSPPRIAPGEAGLLVDGRFEVRDTTATLLELAVRGGIGLTAADGGRGPLVTLRDPSVAVLPHQQILMQHLFVTGRPGETVDLSERGTLRAAHQQMTRQLLSDVESHGWYTRLPRAVGGPGRFALPLVGGVLFLGAGGSIGSILSNASWLLPVAPPVVAALAAQAATRNGQRSPVGRALTDQIEGFRTYLATAEAEELKFQEGEDIFSRYLPWATIFGLTERWTRVCARLVELGRIPDAAPHWYAGHWNGLLYFHMADLSRSLEQAAMPEVQASSGDGFGSGGSAFSGGGFSGSGGGGGSIGDW